MIPVSHCHSHYELCGGMGPLPDAKSSSRFGLVFIGVFVEELNRSRSVPRTPCMMFRHLDEQKARVMYGFHQDVWQQG